MLKSCRGHTQGLFLCGPVLYGHHSHSSTSLPCYTGGRPMNMYPPPLLQQADPPCSPPSPVMVLALYFAPVEHPSVLVLVVVVAALVSSPPQVKGELWQVPLACPLDCLFKQGPPLYHHPMALSNSSNSWIKRKYFTVRHVWHWFISIQLYYTGTVHCLTCPTWNSIQVPVANFLFISFPFLIICSTSLSSFCCSTSSSSITSAPLSPPSPPWFSHVNVLFTPL